MTFFNNAPFNELIKRGHIYIAQPPLYKIKSGKEINYLSDEKELDHLAIKNGLEKIDHIKFASNGSIKDHDKFVEDCYKFVSFINKIDGDKEILEYLSILGSFTSKNNKLIILEDKNDQKKIGAIEAVASHLNSFLDKSEEKWIGLFEKNKFILKRSFYNELIIKELSSDFLKNEKITKELSNFTDTVKHFRTKGTILEGENTLSVSNASDLISHIVSIGKKNISLQRFKGLGEMNPDELWETTLNPENNSLLKVNYSEQDGEITIPSNSDNEIFYTLMGEDVSKRKNFINTHAINVVNLDV